MHMIYKATYMFIDGLSVDGIWVKTNEVDAIICKAWLSPGILRRGP